MTEIETEVRGKGKVKGWKKEMEEVIREIMKGIKEWGEEIRKVAKEWREGMEDIRKEIKEMREREKKRRKKKKEMRRREAVEEIIEVIGVKVKIDGNKENSRR